MVRTKEDPEQKAACTRLELNFLPGEYWYLGIVQNSRRHVFSEQASFFADLRGNRTNNQMAPLLLSSKGRVLYAPQGMTVAVSAAVIQIETDGICLTELELGVKAASLAGAARAYFAYKRNEARRSGMAACPAPELCRSPIYNTWIELVYEQKEEAVLHYAQSALAAGFPSGVLMIDDFWGGDYGDFSWDRGRFLHAEEMIGALRQLGFTLMLWVSPYVSPDSRAFRFWQERDLLLKRADGRVKIIEWWNGFSAAIDLVKGGETLCELLDGLQVQGVAGFKFDGADPFYYLWAELQDRLGAGTAANLITDGSLGPLSPFPGEAFKALSEEEKSAMAQCEAWSKIACRYSFNELRCSFDSGCLPLFSRLCDKTHNWDDRGLGRLVGDSLFQALTGHVFHCPDMVGGGEYLSFDSHNAENFDRELFIRFVEASVFMPSVQFSAAPWRLLGAEDLAHVRKLLSWRQRYFVPLIESLWTDFSETLEPIMRPLEWQYPCQGFEAELDCFMVGEHFLVAPVLERGASALTLRLPEGGWLCHRPDRAWEEAEVFSGGQTQFIEVVRGPLVFSRIAEAF